MAWSLSYGSNVNCSFGVKLYSFILFTYAITRNYLTSKHNIRFVCWINATCFQGNQKMASVLQVQMTILCYDSGLVGLCNISEDHINHPNQKSVIQGHTGIVNDWNDICSFFCHAYQITTNSVRKLNCVNNTFWSYNVRNMRNSCSWSCTQV